MGNKQMTFERAVSFRFCTEEDANHETMCSAGSLRVFSALLLLVRLCTFDTRVSMKLFAARCRLII